MKKALIDPNGILVQVEDTEFAVADPFYWIDVADDVTPATHIWDGISIVIKPPIPLNQVKNEKITSIIAARDAACLLDVSALGTQWQADERSQKLLGDAITLATAGLPLPTVWRDANNVNLPITSIGQLLDIAGSMAIQTQAAYARSWLLKTQIEAATNAAFVALINF